MGAINGILMGVYAVVKIKNLKRHFFLVCFRGDIIGKLPLTQDKEWSQGLKLTP